MTPHDWVVGGATPTASDSDVLQPKDCVGVEPLGLVPATQLEESIAHIKVQVLISDTICMEFFIADQYVPYPDANNACPSENSRA